MWSWLARVRMSVVLYPVTVVYCGAVGVIMLVSTLAIGVPVAIAALAALCLIVVIASVQHELKAVHSLVNSQRDEMLAEIVQLKALLADEKRRPQRD